MENKKYKKTGENIKSRVSPNTEKKSFFSRNKNQKYSGRGYKFSEYSDSNIEDSNPKKSKRNFSSDNFSSESKSRVKRKSFFSDDSYYSESRKKIDFQKSEKNFSDNFQKKNYRDNESEKYYDRDFNPKDNKRRNFSDKDSKFRTDKKYSKLSREEGYRPKRDEEYRSENRLNENDRDNYRNTESKQRYEKRDFDKKNRTEKFYKKSNIKKFSKKSNEEIRLNKFISNSGICSRREADILISTGVVKVNGKIIDSMGYKVLPGDHVTVDGRELKSEKKVYLLLNKPKDTITTTMDPTGRKTVMDIVKNACKERVYPVGRLDRNTTGLLIMTNDGDMAKRLMHPSHKIIKVYEATLDRNLTKEDLISISQGVQIEEYFVPVDGVEWSEHSKKNVVGIQIHSGKYHVVKKIFEHFGYKVLQLDRNMFGPLTKKNLPRGTWRFLSEDEISILHRL